MLLAQISDLHVRPAGERYKDAVDSNRMFGGAVEHLNRLDPQPDLVLITGDLVDEGSRAEYDCLRGLLAGLELPCLLMPGNHDDRQMLAECFPDHAYLPAHGASIMSSTDRRFASCRSTPQCRAAITARWTSPVWPAWRRRSGTPAGRRPWCRCIAHRSPVAFPISTGTAAGLLSQHGNTNCTESSPRCPTGLLS